MPFARLCEKCGKRFIPESAGRVIYRRKICDNCLKQIRDENFKKMMCFRSNIKMRGFTNE